MTEYERGFRDGVEAAARVTDENADLAQSWYRPDQDAEWTTRLANRIRSLSPSEQTGTNAPSAATTTGGCQHRRTETRHGAPWTCLDCGRIYIGIESRWGDPPAPPKGEERCGRCGFSLFAGNCMNKACFEGRAREGGR